MFDFLIFACLSLEIMGWDEKSILLFTHTHTHFPTLTTNHPTHTPDYTQTAPPEQAE